MQIGFDVGATKIESVVLDKEGTEHFRERRDCPKDYNEIIKLIKNTSLELEKKNITNSSSGCLSSRCSFTTKWSC